LRTTADARNRALANKAVATGDSPTLVSRVIVQGPVARLAYLDRSATTVFLHVGVGHGGSWRCQSSWSGPMLSCRCYCSLRRRSRKPPHRRPYSSGRSWRSSCIRLQILVPSSQM
jgi:hypothetical protein